MAIRAAALRKPRARVMRALTWAFSASARPFEGPPPRVAPMGVLYRDRVLASLVNSGMRHRCAQAITPRMRDLPWPPLTLNASRICSLIRYPLYSGLLVTAIWAREPRWPGVSLAWSLRSAHIPEPRA